VFATNRRNFDTKIGQVVNPVVTHLGSNPVKNIMPVTRSQTRHLRTAPYVPRPTIIIPPPGQGGLCLYDVEAHIFGTMVTPAYSPTSPNPPGYPPWGNPGTPIGVPHPLWGNPGPGTPIGTPPPLSPVYDPTRPTPRTPEGWVPYDPTATPPITPITSPMPAPTTVAGWAAHYDAIADYNRRHRSTV
jgi:hypothetical protein